MNILDIVVIVVFLGVFTAAFFAGVARSLAGLGSLVAATIVAAIFYGTIGTVLSRWLIPIDPVIANFGAFLLLMLGAGIGIDYLLLRSFRISKLRTHMSLEFRGGVTGILGLVVLSALLSVVMVTVLTQSSNNTVQQLPYGWGTTWMRNEYDESILTAQVMRLSPYVFDSVDAVTPGIVPAILQPITGS